MNILNFSWCIVTVSVAHGRQYYTFSLLFSVMYAYTCVHIFLSVYFRWPGVMSEGHEDHRTVSGFLNISSHLLVLEVKLPETF